MTVQKRIVRRLERELYGFSEDLEALGFAPRILKSLTLVLTANCNLRCGYCYADRKNRRSMLWEVVTAAIDLMHCRGCAGSKISLYGGEPLLRPSFIRRIVDHVDSIWEGTTRPTIVLCTNGTLLDPTMLRWIVEHDLIIQLSSDGVEAAQSRRGDNTFPTLDTLLNVIALEYPQFMKSRLVLKLTLTAANVKYLAESIRYFVGIGVCRVDVAPLETHDPGWDATSSTVLEEQMDSVRALCLARSRSGMSIPCSLFSHGSTTNSNSLERVGMCGFGQGTDLVVDVDGSIAACSAFIQSFQSSRGELHADLLANATIGNILEIEESSLISDLRRRRDQMPVFLDRKSKWSGEGACRDCQYNSRCFVCPASIAQIPENTDPHRIPDNQCAFNLVVGRQRELFHKDVDQRPGSEKGQDAQV